MQLPATANKLLSDIARMLAAANVPALTSLANETTELQQRLEQPLRVAVVGTMNAGKSTLLNSILKERILFTDKLEATYTVSWFKYGETPRLRVVFSDNAKAPEDAPYSDLAKWTVRPKGAETHALDGVRHVEIYYPNEMLKRMELIDTPGLQSSTKEASGHTSDFLGQRLSEDADKLTAENASQAEAIIYAFSLSLDANDAAVLGAFGGDSRKSSPINAVGIWTKADTYWRHNGAPMEESPLAIVAQTNQKYRNMLRDRLYTIFPVVAKSVENITCMDDRSYDILTRLAAADPQKLKSYLSAERGFMERPAAEGMPVSPEDRAHVLRLYGQYGIFAAVSALNGGVAREALPEHMYRISGVSDACDMIMRHFGNRSFLIKLEYILNRVRTQAGQIKRDGNVSGRVAMILNQIVEDIDNLYAKEQTFQELALLKDYYEGTLKLPPELETEFLQLTGEDGSGCERKLGFSAAAPIADLRREASKRSQTWNSLASRFGVSRQINAAAEVVARTCDNIFYHLDMLAGFDE